MDAWVRDLREDLVKYVKDSGSLENAMKGLESFLTGRLSGTQAAMASWLAPALLAALLAGFADVQTAESAPVEIANAGEEMDWHREQMEIANAGEISGAFNVKFQEAIDFFKSKEVVSPDEFAALENAAKARSFTASKLSNSYLQDQLKESLQGAMDKGQTLNGWLDGIEKDFDAFGLSGDRAYLQTVFRTNVNTAYAAGRYVQMHKVARQRPYWQYITVAHGEPKDVQVRDHGVRPDHAVLDGVIKPSDDDFWKTHYPPLGYNCRCQVVSLSKEELKAEGLDVTSDEQIQEDYSQLVPSAGAIPRVDPRFAMDPAEAFGGLEKLT